ncbi:putative geraniol 8-hydroxylase [Helianthus annuus]|uniref:cytochrome P450 76T24 isoform X1 n=1 Tax=Helianthus annuus TaxID=4232 RepID=UPI000B8FD470|nr:cytochrome P450 76T24 isoform X1 [Helianthus annuus]KAJ0598314.1 putative geraniol 8-hydroxylase [Helianthus annuus]KAJ0758945.1 putative geraniol 8-hydroxylase [Helianthus annuus]KAJ0928467.1 putative geraniol 8-hydroxylase [Helianthus annuus]
MDYLTLSILFSFFITLILAYAITISGRRSSRLPPGPFPFPIIGNLLYLSDKPHQSLATLSKRYGPLMSLKFGTRTTIVVSSPYLAKEFLQTHDHSFSSRSVPDAARVVDHEKYSIVWLPVGEKWRKLRRISKEYVFSMQRLDASELLRQTKVKELVDHIDRCCISEKVVDIGGIAFTTSFNVLSNLIFSMDFAQYDSSYSQEFKDDVRALLELGGKPNISDFFPVLKFFDLQGLLRRGNLHAKNILTIFDKVIDKRLQTRSTSLRDNDVLDSLLNLNQMDESAFSRNDMRHLFFNFFIGGTDTTSTTLEWAMAELIHNQDKLATARLEIIKLMENKEKIIQESDIPQLPYLQAVIKETLRLHPPVPFLIPRQALHNIEIQGFMVPKNAQILCNLWAMGRDPKVWSHPDTFMPERFLQANVDYRGQDFELIPFGAGRRICPGLNMAHRMLHIMLGSLIQKFDWKLEGNKRAQDMDMGEKFGITLQRSAPLKAIPLKL